MASTRSGKNGNGGRRDSRYDDRYDDRYEDDDRYDDSYDDRYDDRYEDDDRDDRYEDRYEDDDRYDGGYDEDNRVTGKSRTGGQRSSQNRSGQTRSTQGKSSQTRSGQRTGGNGGKKNISRKRKAKKNRRIIMFVVELLVLVVLGVVLWGVRKQTQIQKININEDDIVINNKVEENTALKGYWNIALFGIDARSNNLGKGDRSDTIMIASLNQDTKEVKLCSVYRDTYMNLGTGTYDKCNSAYSKGGPEQAINMLNMNMDMNITNYITIGFEGMKGVVDALGGVEIDVTDAEILHLNNYQLTMAEQLGIKYTEVTKPGRQTLNGLQATAYCRIRYTAGDDFKRAERQRTVLMECLNKAQTASFSTLSETLDAILPHVSTNLDTADMLSVLKDIAGFKIVGNDGFPFESNRATGKVGKSGSCVIATSLEDNVILLHRFLFDQQDYVPSPEVVEYSNKAGSDTAKYQ